MAEKKKTTKPAAVKTVSKKKIEPKTVEHKVEHKVEPKKAELKVEHHVAKPRKVQIPAGPRYYGTGRRKEATARVYLKPGSGKILVNGQSYQDYFCHRKLLEVQVMRPLLVTNTAGNYDVFAETFGGGIPAQATAVSHGMSRALLEVSPDFRLKLKRVGLLTRDPRTKERKKYGLKRARRAFQFTKR
jgi:small subunit ribosomal protein S9